MNNLKSYLNHLDLLNLIGGRISERVLIVECTSGDVATITYRIDEHTDSVMSLQAVLTVSIGDKNVFVWGAVNESENAIIVRWMAIKMNLVLGMNNARDKDAKRNFQESQQAYFEAIAS